MSEKKHPLGFTFADGRVSGTLRVGLSVNGVLHRDFEVREATVDDLLDAELEADVTKPLNFNAQLMVRQLVRVGSFEGPFTVGMIRRLKPVDWRILRAAQSEIDDLGEDEPDSEPAS
ncbi:phage tail assembly protein [Rhodocyclus tenuis]|uniref:Phage FluMu protein gp41 n=1 Tax=Rhodocyclus tenuis TaxID=1066 RepID=A0A840G6I3_RHOTE|nr:phage tail assembly protein [Rhodocyclus tenuis]MBB4246560.1 phage FluMu protein gp41 [Rhodocyclus tenuis]